MPPRRDYNIVDTWFVSGLKGAVSKDISEVTSYPLQLGEAAAEVWAARSILRQDLPGNYGPRPAKRAAFN